MAGTANSNHFVRFQRFDGVLYVLIGMRSRRGQNEFVSGRLLWHEAAHTQTDEAPYGAARRFRGDFVVVVRLMNDAANRLATPCESDEDGDVIE